MRRIKDNEKWHKIKTSDDKLIQYMDMIIIYEKTTM